MAEQLVTPALSSDSQSNSIWSETNRSLTIGLLLTIVAAAFESLAVAATMPDTVRDLGGLELYGWGFSAFMLANLIGITLAGVEADRQGPLGPYLLGSVLFGVGLLIAGLAPSMIIFIMGRAVQGFGAGFVSSVTYVVIGRGYSDSDRPRMLALTSSAWVVPGLIGPALAGTISGHFGWRWVFLGLLPFLIVAVVMAAPSMRRLSQKSTAPRDYTAAVRASLLALGTGLLLGGLGVLAPSNGVSVATMQLVLGVVLSVVGVVIAIPMLQRLLPAGTLRAAAGVPAAVATQTLLNMAFFGVESFITLGLTEVRGLTSSVAGITLTATTITWTLGSWVQAYLAPRGLRRQVSIAGLMLIVLGTLGFLAVLLPTVPSWLAPFAWGVAGLGIGLSFSTHTLVVLEQSQPGQEGAASAALQLGNVLGVALGAGIGGVIIAGTNTGNGPQLGITIHSMLMIGVLVLGMLTAMRLPKKAVK
jgi:MFS family permease